MQACDKLIKKCCAEVRSLPGDAAEIGVWQGDSAALIARELPGCQIHLFDTFCGMPAEMVTAGVDYHQAGAFSDSGGESRVRSVLGESLSRCVIHCGVFPVTAPDHLQLKFLHVDCDLYKSYLAAMEFADKWMLPHGIVLLDDYSCSSAAGAKIAVDEFLLDNPHTFTLEKTGYRAILRRPSGG